MLFYQSAQRRLHTAVRWILLGRKPPVLGSFGALLIDRSSREAGFSVRSTTHDFLKVRVLMSKARSRRRCWLGRCEQSCVCSPTRGGDKNRLLL